MYKLRYSKDADSLEWVHKHDSNIIRPLSDFSVNHDLKPEVVQRLLAHTHQEFDPTQIDQQVWNSLHDAQREGVEFIVKQGGRALIADEMGTGKTRQAIVSTMFFPDVRPILVVCPLSLRKNWKKEWAAINAEKVQVIKNSAAKIDHDANVVVISYGLIKSANFSAQLTSKYWGFIIFDECHAVKNIKSQQTRFALGLSKVADHVLCMSGTPMNQPKDMYTIIQCVRPNLFTRWYHPSDRTKFYFANRYCGPRMQSMGKYRPPVVVFDGCTRTDEMYAILRYMCMIRRTKDEVMTLPAKTRERVSVGSYTEKQFKDMKQFINKVRDNSKLMGDAKFMEMVQNTSKTKVELNKKYFQEHVWPQLDADPKLKIIIFGHFLHNLSELQSFIAECNYGHIFIDGRTAGKKRQPLVDQFQDDEHCRIALLSLKACSSGLTLTKATQVYITDLLWNPEDCLQAEDRAHRFGQDQEVSIKYLVMENSTDDMLFNLICKKYTNACKILENDNKKLRIG